MERNNGIPVIGVSRHRLGTDGNGVTTLVAFHGCNLRCKYCLNPEALGSAEGLRRYTPESLYEGVIIREEVSQKLREHYRDNLYDEPKTGLDGGYEILPPDSPKIKEIEEYNRKLRPALYAELDKTRNNRNLR